MTIYAVIGSSYGDEGKGVFTHYLSKKDQGHKKYVIRYNGGAQAGHTVEYQNNRHVFGHIGANSFLNHSATVLSEYFVSNPLLFLKEKAIFEKTSAFPEVYVHKNSYVSTAYDMIINQLLEKKRQNQKHGSCGVGFGQTIERNEVDKVTLNYKDLYQENSLFDKFKAIQNHFYETVKKNGLEDYLGEYAFLKEDSFLENMINKSIDYRKYTKIYEKENDFINFKEDAVVFEGAQGLMLDLDWGTFPYVTRSNTGLKNIEQIMLNNKWQDIEIVYATRAYTTRHGAGPLLNELKEKPYAAIVDKTNVNNPYQDSLRYAYLNLDILMSSIKNDLKYSKNIKASISLGISCLDQSDNFKYWLNNNLYTIKNNLFSEKIQENLILNGVDIKNVYESFSAQGPK